MLLAALFLVVSCAPMVAWAQKKHRAYKKDFGKAYTTKYAIIPMII